MNSDNFLSSETIEEKVSFMKGTAILYQQNERLIFLENIDKTAYEELKKQCGRAHCHCTLGEKQFDCGKISQVLWKENINWNYGY